MTVLNICHRTLPAYRHIFVHDEDWITSRRTALYYLDLSVSNEVLFNKHFDKVSPKNLMSVNIKKRQFHPDDCISDSNFYSYALSKKVDRIGMELFALFYMKNWKNLCLESGESVVRFLNMATVFGAGMWKDFSFIDNPPVEKVNFSNIYPTILKGLYKKKSEHPLLVKKLWDYFCVTDENKYNLFLSAPDTEHLEFMMEVANRTRFDFWGMRYGSELFTKRVVHHYIRQFKFKWVEILLQYGFALEKGDPKGTHNLGRHYTLQSYLFRFDWNKTISNKFLVWLLATVYAMYPPIFKLPGFIGLYQKVYRSLPHPSQPPSIFRKNLQQVLLSYEYHDYRTAADRRYLADENPCKTIQSVTEDIIKAYVKCVECDIHPTESSVVAPRKLSHLSRHVLRENLRGNFQLPTAIDDLNLPTFLKRFLKLEF